MNSVSIMKEIKDDSRREPIKSIYTFGVKTTVLALIALIPIQHVGHSGDFGNTAKMVGKITKSVMQLISIRF